MCFGEKNRVRILSYSGFEDRLDEIESNIDEIVEDNPNSDIKEVYSKIKDILELTKYSLIKGNIEIKPTEEAQAFFGLYNEIYLAQPIKRRSGTIYRLIGEEEEIIELEETDIALKKNKEWDFSNI
ncbi:hypothetical protein [Clostridium perfringens]|nr:hypothetical protein [Clostridium perfringens]